MHARMGQRVGSVRAQFHYMYIITSVIHILVPVVPLLPLVPVLRRYRHHRRHHRHPHVEGKRWFGPVTSDVVVSLHVYN